jgi:hypothetical protein
VIADTGSERREQPEQGGAGSDANNEKTDAQRVHGEPRGTLLFSRQAAPMERVYQSRGGHQSILWMSPLRFGRGAGSAGPSVLM